ncbi:siderophore synthetase component [Sediminihabitans luteus]|uniref:Lysine N-acyltransferase MbtK n=1 Tax=Sediminihabitans luteus TaxID=1138585 RepID=A0A2M9CQR5_9CELL|nr:GNAT family N-acetyltransferase [Sediminihabitans luteus]PJJ74280.1 siderophore synthetase component [Sediminihabitans luteus]GII99133.1 hypothetical protein Slu03_15110 [Sediminihabitans luteus]
MNEHTVRTRVGTVVLRPATRDDAPTLHAWLTDPHAAFWAMGDHDLSQVRDYLDALVQDPAQAPWLGTVDGEPAVYVETYDPARVLLDQVHDAAPGDLGMHLLVAPPGDAPRHGFTSALMSAVVRFCLHGLGAARVVVEPDVRNTAIAAKNAAAGFRVLREVDLPGKRAALSVCTRDDFAASPLGDGVDLAPHLRAGADVPDAGTPDTGDAASPMARAHRHLVAKTLAELSHERLLAPRALGDAEADPQDRATWAWFELALDTDHGLVVHRFRAARFALEHWVIDEPSITRTVDGAAADLDALALVVELQPVLAIPDALLATYLEEVSSTLAAGAAKDHAGGPRADELADADLPTVEAAMTEGHPAFVANNGRIGFSLDDYLAYAPERGARTRLVWLAAHRDHTHLALGAGLDEATHLARQITPDEHAAFTERLAARGHDPAAYHLLPVHPWQWQHRVPVTFAADVARGDLVPLGTGADEYQPQQSIRTLLNRTRPGADYVKVALAIQNMGFLRGLSPAYMRVTPQINDWVHDLVAGDPGFAGFEVLREHASIGYTGDVYHRTAAPSAHRKMLAALWRENPTARTAPGERCATMAALLHRDAHGASYATALVRRSGLDARTWLRAYLDVYLRPLVHALLAHDLAFMPHGENLILVLRDHVPVRAYMKDIGEEVAVLGERALPPEVERVRAVVDDTEKALAIFTDVFDGVLRHLAGILAVDGTLPETAFWAEVADVIDTHRAEHPDLRTGVDLRAQRFAHSCLNRLQLRNTLQMVDLTDQSSSLLYAGTLANPARA